MPLARTFSRFSPRGISAEFFFICLQDVVPVGFCVGGVGRSEVVRAIAAAFLQAPTEKSPKLMRGLHASTSNSTWTV